MGTSRWSRLFITTLLMMSFLWLWWTRLDELSYHTWETHSLKNIGDAKEFASNKENFEPNDYVEVVGVLGNKAATVNGLRAGSFRFGRYQIRHLLGSKLFIEYDEEIYHDRFQPFREVRVIGRLTNFGPGSELEKVREFFKNYYKYPIPDDAMLIVANERPQGELKYAALFFLSSMLMLISIFITARTFYLKK